MRCRLSRTRRRQTRRLRPRPYGPFRRAVIGIAPLCEDTFYYDLPPGVSPHSVGITPATYMFGSFKNDVERALVNKFGRANVRRGNKASASAP